MTLTKLPTHIANMFFGFFTVKWVAKNSVTYSSGWVGVLKFGVHDVVNMGAVKVVHHHHYSSPAHGGKWPSRTVGTSEIELS